MSAPKGKEKLNETLFHECPTISGTSQDTDKKPTMFHMKKSLKLKQLKRRGKNKRKSSMPATEASVDAMVE
nr:hypothetical protein CFP56_29276 [Quercus suber]